MPVAHRTPMQRKYLFFRAPGTEGPFDRYAALVTRVKRNKSAKSPKKRMHAASESE